jgi:hypothetical protein
MICNYNGIIQYSKIFYTECSFKQIRATTWNIILLCEKGKKGQKNTIADIYDFKLENIYSISLDRYTDELFINNNEFAFRSKDKLLIYNNDTFKSALVELQSNHENGKFYVYRRDNFLHLNSIHLYFINGYKTVYALDRQTGCKLFSFELKFNSDFELRVVKFDSESNIYSFNLNEKIINVYNPFGEKLYKIQLEKRFLTMCFDAYDQIICHQGVVKKFILEFEIY